MLRALFFVVSTLVVALPAMAAENAPASTIIIKAGTVAPKGTPWERQMRRTRKHVAKDSDKRIKMKLYLGGQKGDEKSLVRQCRDGRLEFVGVSSAAMATEVPALQVIELPFLFESTEEADFVLDSFLFEPTDKILRKHGFVLSQWGENGWQNFGLKKGFVKSPADLKGRKMRSQESAVHLAAWKAFGASPVEMAVSEVLPALKTGLVEGFEQTPLFTFAAGWHQGIGYYTISHHVYQPAILAYSKIFFDKLSPKDQAILLAHRASDTLKGRLGVRKIEPSLVQNFEAYGIKVYTLSPAERAVFVAVALQVQNSNMKTATKDAKILWNAIQKSKAAFKKRG